MFLKSLRFIKKKYLWYFHCLFINNFTICMHMMCWIHKVSNKHLVCIVFALMHIVTLFLSSIFYNATCTSLVVFDGKIYKMQFFFTFHISTSYNSFVYIDWIHNTNLILYFNTRLHQELNDMYIYLYVIYYLGQTIGQL